MKQTFVSPQTGSEYTLINTGNAVVSYRNLSEGYRVRIQATDDSKILATLLIDMALGKRGWSYGSTGSDHISIDVNTKLGLSLAVADAVRAITYLQVDGSPQEQDQDQDDEQDEQEQESVSGDTFVSPQTQSVYVIVTQGDPFVSYRKIEDEDEDVYRVRIQATDPEILKVLLDDGLRDWGWKYGKTGNDHISITVDSDEACQDAISEAVEAVKEMAA